MKLEKFVKHHLGGYKIIPARVKNRGEYRGIGSLKDNTTNMERLLSVSRELGDKVQQNESATGELLRQCEELREELRAMRQVRLSTCVVDR